MNKDQRKQINALAAQVTDAYTKGVAASDVAATLYAHRKIAGAKDQIPYLDIITPLHTTIESAKNSLDILGELEDLESDEQDKYDNMPEAFQSGDRGDKIQTGIDALNDAGTALQEAYNGLDGVLVLIDESKTSEELLPVLDELESVLILVDVAAQAISNAAS